MHCPGCETQIVFEDAPAGDANALCPTCGLKIHLTANQEIFTVEAKDGRSGQAWTLEEAYVKLSHDEVKPSAPGRVLNIEELYPGQMVVVDSVRHGFHEVLCYRGRLGNIIMFWHPETGLNVQIEGLLVVTEFKF